MRRILSIGFAFLAVSALFADSIGAATLETLSLERLVLESTAIVRARASEPRAMRRGPVIYTVYSLSPSEQLKGASIGAPTAAVPGGRIGDAEQHFAGAPELVPGREYLLFLWTGPSGLTQITGLSQGLFELQTDSEGEWIAVRLLDPELRPSAPAPSVQTATTAGPVRRSYRELREEILAILSRSASEAPVR